MEDQLLRKERLAMGQLLRSQEDAKKTNQTSIEAAGKSQIQIFETQTSDFSINPHNPFLRASPRLNDSVIGSACKIRDIQNYNAAKATHHQTQQYASTKNSQKLDENQSQFVDSKQQQTDPNQTDLSLEANHRCSDSLEITVKADETGCSPNDHDYDSIDRDIESPFNVQVCLERTNSTKQLQELLKSTRCSKNTIQERSQTDLAEMRGIGVMEGDVSKDITTQHIDSQRKAFTNEIMKEQNSPKEPCQSIKHSNSASQQDASFINLPLHSKNMGDVQAMNKQDCIMVAASHQGGKSDKATMDLNSNPDVIADISIPVTVDTSSMPKKSDSGVEEIKKAMDSGSLAIKGQMDTPPAVMHDYFGKSSQQFHDHLIASGSVQVVKSPVAIKSSKNDDSSVRELSHGNLTKQDISSRTSGKSLHKRSQMQQLTIIGKPTAHILHTSHDKVPSREGTADYEEFRQHGIIQKKYGLDVSRPTSMGKAKLLSKHVTSSDQAECQQQQYSQDLVHIFPFNKSDKSIANEDQQHVNTRQNATGNSSPSHHPRQTSMHRLAILRQRIQHLAVQGANLYSPENAALLKIYQQQILKLQQQEAKRGKCSEYIITQYSLPKALTRTIPSSSSPHQRAFSQQQYRQRRGNQQTRRYGTTAASICSGTGSCSGGSGEVENNYTSVEDVEQFTYNCEIKKGLTGPQGRKLSKPMTHRLQHHQNKRKALKSQPCTDQFEQPKNGGSVLVQPQYEIPSCVNLNDLSLKVSGSTKAKSIETESVKQNLRINQRRLELNQVHKIDCRDNQKVGRINVVAQSTHSNAPADDGNTRDLEAEVGDYQTQIMQKTSYKKSKGVPAPTVPRLQINKVDLRLFGAEDQASPANSQRQKILAEMKGVPDPIRPGMFSPSGLMNIMANCDQIQLNSSLFKAKQYAIQPWNQINHQLQSRNQRNRMYFSEAANPKTSPAYGGLPAVSTRTNQMLNIDVQTEVASRVQSSPQSSEPTKPGRLRIVKRETSVHDSLQSIGSGESKDMIVGQEWNNIVETLPITSSGSKVQITDNNLSTKVVCQQSPQLIKSYGKDYPNTAGVKQPRPKPAVFKNAKKETSTTLFDGQTNESMNDLVSVPGIVLVSKNAESATFGGQIDENMMQSEEAKKDCDGVDSAIGLVDMHDKNSQSQIQRARSSSRGHQNSTERNMEKSDDLLEPSVSNVLAKKNTNQNSVDFRQNALRGMMIQDDSERTSLKTLQSRNNNQSSKLNRDLKYQTQGITNKKGIDVFVKTGKQKLQPVRTKFGSQLSQEQQKQKLKISFAKRIDTTQRKSIEAGKNDVVPPPSARSIENERYHNPGNYHDAAENNYTSSARNKRSPIKSLIRKQHGSKRTSQQMPKDQIFSSEYVPLKIDTYDPGESLDREGRCSQQSKNIDQLSRTTLFQQLTAKFATSAADQSRHHESPSHFKSIRSPNPFSACSQGSMDSEGKSHQSGRIQSEGSSSRLQEVKERKPNQIDPQWLDKFIHQQHKQYNRHNERILQKARQERILASKTAHLTNIQEKKRTPPISKNRLLQVPVKPHNRTKAISIGKNYTVIEAVWAAQRNANLY